MSDRNGSAPWLIATSIGLALWLLTTRLTGRREAWDSSLYWLLAYPLALVACGALARWFPERPWRWALVLFQGQFVGMCLVNREVGSLWPLGMLLFAVLALPGVWAARVAVRYR